MRIGSRMVTLCVFSLAGLILCPGRTYADGGVHVVHVSPMNDDQWRITEFIDSSLIGYSLSVGEGEQVQLEIDIGLMADPSYEVTIQSVSVDPLLLYHNSELSGLEDRIVRDEQTRERSRIRSEMDRQLIGALFQVPIWPYLAASELPLSGVDITRLHRLPNWRESQFPAANYAGTGDVKNWQVVEYTGRSAVVEMTHQSGEGMGLVLHYIVTGDLNNIRFIIPGQASVSALYIEDITKWSVEGSDFEEVMTYEVLGRLVEGSARISGSGQYSSIRIQDGDGYLGRFLSAPNSEEHADRILWAMSGTEREGIIADEESGPGVLLTFAICWLVFGGVISVGNRMYAFSRLGTIELLARSLLVYPVFLVGSLLAIGFWGLGFIPAAVAGVRMVSYEGRRLQAFGVVLSACFVVLFISFIIMN